jgi:hypothetical protein
MTRVDRPALRGTLLGRLLRAWNPVYRVVLRTPLLHWPWSRLALVIEFTGMKSGRTYRTPAHYVRDGDRLLLTSGDRWCHNLAGGVPVRVWLDGRERRGTAELVTDEEESLALHLQMIERRPIFGRLIGLTRGDEHEGLRRSLRAGRRAVVISLH